MNHACIQQYQCTFKFTVLCTVLLFTMNKMTPMNDELRFGNVHILNPITWVYWNYTSQFQPYK